MDDRRAFFRKFFPKWSGFYVDSFDHKIQLAEALQKLQCLYEGISNVWVTTSGYYSCRAVDSHKLELGQVGVTSS